MAQNAKCNRCGSFNLDIVAGYDIAAPDIYVCRGCGLRRNVEKSVLIPEQKKTELEKILTIEERAMAQLIEIAEERSNEPLVRIEACKVILGR